jgi:hypothetical protein
VNTNLDEGFKPPYISFRTLLNLVEKMADQGTPPRIDRSFLSGSEGGKTQVLAALRGLGFIDSDGNVTPLLTRMVKNPAERGVIVKELLEQHFPKPVHLGSINATQGQLQEAFKEYGISGDTMRKAIAFYLRAAEFASVPVSPLFKTPSIQRADGTPGRKATPRAKGKIRRELENRDQQQTPLGGTAPNVHPALAAVLGDLPTFGKSWTRDERDNWRKAFDTMLDYSIPIVAVEDLDDEDEDDIEDEDEVTLEA